MVSVTLSPSVASPPTVPVTLIVVRASAALITLAAVIASKAIVGAGAVVSMTTANAGAGRDTLLSISVTVAVKLLLPSASAFAVISMYLSLMSWVESTPLPTSVAPSYKLTTSPATGAVAPVPLSATPVTLIVVRASAALITLSAVIAS